MYYMISYVYRTKTNCHLPPKIGLGLTWRAFQEVADNYLSATYLPPRQINLQIFANN